MKKLFAALAALTMLAGTSATALAVESNRESDLHGCVYDFSQMLYDGAIIRCGDYLSLYFKGNYGTDVENLFVDTAEISEIAELIGQDDVDYYNFIANPKFATAVTVGIEADKNAFLYAYQDGKIEEISTAKYSNDEWTFRTNKLGCYFVTEEELSRDLLN